MNKREREILEAAFVAEMNAALDRLPDYMRLIQRRGKLIERMADEGLLERRVALHGPVTITGYALTHAGRFAYCCSCGEALE